MTNTPSETEIDNLLCKHWPGYSRQAVLVKMWLREAIESAIAKWAAPQPQAGAVPQRWKAVPVNPTPEMWKAAKTVPDPNPPYPPHYGLVWDAMLAASPTPTPTAEQQASPKAAPQQEAQEPVVAAVFDEQLGRPMLVEGAPMLSHGQPLYTAPVPRQIAPQPAPAPLSEMPYEMLDTVDRRNVFRAGFDRGWNAAIAAQGGK